MAGGRQGAAGRPQRTAADLTLSPALKLYAPRFFLTALAALALLAAACGDSGPSATPTTSASAAPAPTATSTPAPTKTPQPPQNARPFPPELRAQVQPIIDRVARLRGTPPKGEVAMNLVGRREAVQYFRDGIEEEDRQRYQVQEDVYRLLGLIPETTRLLDSLLSFLGQGVLGFYDSDLNAFYLLDDIGSIEGVVARSTLVHEFTHALQDQYSDLDALSESREDDWDASLALSHAVEGEAVAMEAAYEGFSWRLVSCFTIPPVTGGGIPYVIRRDLMTWYEDGYCFIDAVKSALPGGAAGVFERLPVSTEQVLHPQKYLAGETPIPVSLPPLAGALGEGWSVVEGSTLGEYALQNLLVLGLPAQRPRVQDAAAGWGGDAWRLYGRDGSRLLQATVAWDSPGDAQQFFLALSDSVRARAAAFEAAEGGFQAVMNGRTWRAAIAGDRVTFVVSDDPLAAERAAAALGLT